MRYVTLPVETEGYAPLWISEPFLAQASVENGQLCYEMQRFQALYVDVEWLDYDALGRMVDLAHQGLPIVLKRKIPKQPGHNPRNGYDVLLEKLNLLAKSSLSEVPNIHPLFRSTRLLPWFWARQNGSSTWVFLAHPKARGLKYPMTYGQAHCDENFIYSIDVEVDTSNGGGNFHSARLEFPPCQSLLLVIQDDCITCEHFDYVPPPAVRELG